MRSVRVKAKAAIECDGGTRDQTILSAVVAIAPAALVATCFRFERIAGVRFFVRPPFRRGFEALSGWAS
jgi:hypothetical protein